MDNSTEDIHVEVGLTKHPELGDSVYLVVGNAVVYLSTQEADNIGVKLVELGSYIQGLKDSGRQLPKFEPGTNQELEFDEIDQLTTEIEPEPIDKTKLH